MRPFLAVLIVLVIAGTLAATANAAILYPTDISGTKNVGYVIAMQRIGTSSTGPEPNDDDQCWSSVSCNSTTKLLLRSTGTGSSGFLAQPDFPRGILVTPSGSLTSDVKITGTDIAGVAITENLSFSSGSAQTTAKAFKTVTRVDATTSGTTRTIKIGTGSNLGLNKKLATNTVIMCAIGLTKDTVSATTVSSTVLSQNTVTTSGTLSSGSPFDVWFMQP